MLLVYNPDQTWSSTKKIGFTIGVLAAGMMMLFLGWQAYIIGPSLIIIGSFVEFFSKKPKYTLI